MTYRHTKIVATLGPASNDPKTLEELIKAGVNVCRLNFSHGTHETHQALFDLIRSLSRKLKRPVAVLQDLCGPKIRVAHLPSEGPHVLERDGKTVVLLKKGEEVILVESGREQRPAHSIGISLPNIAKDVKPGEPILLDDGSLELKVVSSQPDAGLVNCEVVHGGLLKPNKGVNFPETTLSVPSITDKDLKDLEFGLRNEVEFVALSFVRDPSEIQRIKDIIKERGKKIRVVAKMEKREAIEKAEEIVKTADGIMIARGDLGVEYPIQKVPAVQKELIRLVVKHDRFAITATQMLESMTDSPRPTRAEVSDVANAIYDGTDAVMLSGETAAGNYPVETVEMMAKIALSAEEVISEGHHGAKLQSDLDMSTFADALCHSAYTLAKDTKAGVVVTYTRTGRTPLFMSRYRPCPNIIGATDVERVYRQLSVLRAVEPMLIPAVETVRELTVVTEDTIRQRGLAEHNAITIHVGGANLAARSNINSIRIRRLGVD